MRSRSFRGSIGILIAVCFCMFAIGLAAQEMKPSANILLPYFEVRLSQDDAAMQVDTTLAIANASAIATDVEITVYTNWGIPVLTFSDKLRRAQPRAIDLEQWIGQGRIPGRTLAANELAELQAALTGRPSPTDHLYRGTADDDGLAVGYVIARAIGEKREVLWGDTYGIDATTDSFRGDTLATLGDDLQAECSRHAIRFINRDALYEGTQLILWTGRAFEPSPTTEPIGPKVKVVGAIYDEEGNHVGDCMRDVVAVQVIEACSMPGLPASGWIDITLDQPAFVQQHLHAVTAASAELHAWCLPEDLSFKDATTGSISLDKYVNHLDADRPPGPYTPAGATLSFTYSVWNTGAVPLSNIVVTDSEGLSVHCPGSNLEPGSWMECSASAKALACRQKTSATVTARTPDGTQIEDTDPAWYSGLYGRIDTTIEMFMNGIPADSSLDPPILTEGAPVTWTMKITNDGDFPIARVDLNVLEGPALTCASGALAPGASMTCTSTPVPAERGLVGFRVVVNLTDPCGARLGTSQYAYYRVLAPSIRFAKSVNGQEADTEAHAVHVDYGDSLSFHYIVYNAGDFDLQNISISDEEATVTCPSTTLLQNHLMSCTASATALSGLRTGRATATADTAGGDHTTAEDFAYYFGETHPAIDVEMYIQLDSVDHDADDPAHPLEIVNLGQFTLKVVIANTGDVPLYSASALVDLPGGWGCTVSGDLAPGGSGVCTVLVDTFARGQTSFVANATGAPTAGPSTPVTDSDPVYFNMIAR